MATGPTSTAIDSCNCSNSNDKINNNNIVNDETKYQKRRRTVNTSSKRMSWTLFCALFGGAALFLVGNIIHDHFHDQTKQNHRGTMRRAKQIMEERQVAGLAHLHLKHMGGQGGGQGGDEQISDIFKEAKDMAKERHEEEEKEQHHRRNNKDKDNNKNKEEDATAKAEAPGLLTKIFGAKKPDPEMEALRQQFSDLDHDVRENVHGGIRWIKDHLLRELPGQNPAKLLNRPAPRRVKAAFHGGGIDFSVKRKFDPPMAWETEWSQMPEAEQNKGPKIDYTKHDYQYPDLQHSPPERYPFLESMEELFHRWPQDSLDDPPSPIVEKLQHFDYSDDKQRAMATKYRNAELPFKVYNVPELITAAAKWTDGYLANNFDAPDSLYKLRKVPRSKGNCQESHDNFFAFFTPMGWTFGQMGTPPYRNNDWTFQKWADHARYADSVGLSFDQPHFYFQSGVPKTERFDPPTDWTFVSRDLPSFSSTEETFFQFHPDEQKGIQCRFGERGVTAATHYDAGRNMVAMISGAKRYILSPPKECSKLGIVTARGNTLFRHSLLNFGHIAHLTNATSDAGKDMPDKERAWLERTSTALAVETVLKAGEVLFIPSHWFHYINSVQKSAQCNVRSGVDEIGTRAFGGAQEVYECVE